MTYIKKYDRVFVSLEEAAELEEIGHEGIRIRIQRNPNNFTIKKETGEQGGKERTYISVSSLTEKAQKKYKARELRNKNKGEDIKEKWYLKIDINYYKRNYEEAYTEACKRLEIIEKYINLELSSKDIEIKISKEVNKSDRTVRRMLKEYREVLQIVEQNESETEYDYSYLKILAISKKVKLEDSFTSLNREMKAFIENLYYNKTFAQNNNPITNLYEDYEKFCKEKGFEKIACYNTVRRYANWLKNTDGVGARDLVANGLRNWKNKHMLKRLRDTKALKVLEVLQGDVHTFDCFVSVKRANGKLDAIRPALVAWIDMRSRALVGWVITECPDAQIMKQSLIHTIYPKSNEKLPYGVPKFLLIDNGKEYTAKSLTGRERTERVCFDEDAKGFYRSIGIEDDMRSLPYQPWSKAQVERYFRTVELKFGKRMKSYVGSLTTSKTKDKINKDIKKMLENNELLDIEDFAEKFENWVVDEFHSKAHRGLINQGEDTKEPITTFNTAEKYFKASPPLDFAIGLLMKGDIRTVTNVGIERTVKGKKIHYINSELSKYVGKRVEIKYYTEDITKVLVYDEEGKRICEAVSYELLHIAPKLSESGLIEHMKEQKRQQARDTKIIKERSKTFEERETAIDYNEAGKKLVAPALSEERLQPVAFIKDNRYFEDKKARIEFDNHKEIEKEAKKLAEEYLMSKGSQVFKEIQKLG